MIDPAPLGGVSRREFMRLLGMSLAFTGVGACARPVRDTIEPWVLAPEQVIPGRPTWYASALTRTGRALGVLVETHEGRPTKIEGNPAHPASLGATDAFAQAALRALYDPQRSRAPLIAGGIVSWDELVAALLAAAPASGEGVRILTGAISSPTFAAVMARVRARRPGVRWHRWEAVGREHARSGAALAFGRPLEAFHDLSAADRVLALDADFVGWDPAGVRSQRDFARRRAAGGTNGDAHVRLYAVEPAPSLTGDLADHRLALAAGDLPAFAAAFGRAMGLPGMPAAALPPAAAAFARAAAADLAAHRGRALVLVGEPAPPALHAFAHAANHALGAPVRLIEPVDADGDGADSTLAGLVRDMRAGNVRTLVMLGVNPVYDAPADLAFAAALARVPHVFHAGLEADETAARAHAHAPLAHELETWGDARAFDGTVTIQQPTIEPLFGGRSALELLAALAGEMDAAPRELVRRTWQERGLGDDRWRDALRSGLVPGTAAAAVRAAPSPSPLSPAPGAAPPAIELHFRPDPSAWDGRHAANPWLQELPRPFTRIAWDNALLLSPAIAARLGVGDGDRVRVSTVAGAQLAPVIVLPGVAPGVAIAPLGGGRTHAGPVGTGVGFDAHRMRPAAAPWVAPATLERAEGRHAFARAQIELDDQGRGIARVVRAGAALPREPEHRPQLFPDRSATPDGIAWGMSIDLDLCTGCQACVVACQAENNIPPVGREQVARGRAMHWIRVDEDARAAPPLRVHQPVPCMHCENAPCELVCPVGATVHSPEGLNEMVYNRCIGTRYCSNNCPYKVRRFNFLRFAETDAPVLALLKNPNVSVRDRGVMEKCSYCVQRIQEARIGAQVAGRALHDGDVTPACAQACPAQAIVFGNLAEPGSRVARARGDARGYAMLAELGTRPRTTYMARTWNPAPALAADARPPA